MTQKDENLETEKEILDAGFEEIQEDLKELEEIEEKLELEMADEKEEIQKFKETIARMQADNQNFKMRVERDRQDMMFFLKHDIFKKILPRVDDLERMIKNTPTDAQNTPLFEWIIAMEKALKRDLEALWVKAFESIGHEVNPDMHEVMTQIPSEKSGIIVDEFEKGYMLGERVLRVAKVIVWA